MVNVYRFAKPSSIPAHAHSFISLTLRCNRIHGGHNRCSAPTSPYSGCLMTCEEPCHSSIGCGLRLAGSFSPYIFLIISLW